jgi:hypothetical protein
MLRNRINRFLDTLPRTRVGYGGRGAPAFRACGVAGFYVAVIVLMGGGLLTGRSLPVLAGIAAVCALSFFVYTYLRMWITGRETLVLLEHVWFALACVALWLTALREPLLPYLDVVSVALCVFLAAGRVGCTLVGCCHGLPSRHGILYGAACARDGFPRHLVGVRLFPVPAIEGIGLALIGLSGLVALPVSSPGRVFVWFLLAYAVLRFGLEGLRGDRRPHFLGLSQARWMALADVAFALGLADGGWQASTPTLLLLVAVFGLALVLRRRQDLRPRLLDNEHLREVRRTVQAGLEEAARADAHRPSLHTTSGGVAVAVSSSGDAAHVSLSVPGRCSDVRLLCDVAARALPEMVGETARFTAGAVLHLGVASPLPDGDPIRPGTDLLADWLYGGVVRRLQDEERAAEVSGLPPVPPMPSPEARSWYFLPVENSGNETGRGG